MDSDTEVLVVGGGLGGVAAALAALRHGAEVVLTESTDWLGGQMTTQLVPPDEHRRIERQGCSASYRALRTGIREYYRRWYPLTASARRKRYLNPGGGWVSGISHEPRVGVAVIEAMLAPYRGTGRLKVLMEHDPIAVHSEGDRATAVRFLATREGAERTVHAKYILDATETGELLPLAGVEHVTGRESREQTGEPSAADQPQPTDMQSATWCFVMEHRAGEDHTIDRPPRYRHFKELRPPARQGTTMFDWQVPGAHGAGRRFLLEVNPESNPGEVDVDHRRMAHNPDLWTYRRIAARLNFAEGSYASDLTVVNWPMNDYMGGPLYGVDDGARHAVAARELSFSLLYWLQTEVPTPSGGTGYPGLRLRPDVAGTEDGLAKAPYIRESRRIRAMRTIIEQDLSLELRGEDGAIQYSDSVGVGHYYWMDRHATTGGQPGGGGRPLPFEIPLSALVPVRVEGFLPASKNIGTTHITNGCYRLHPVEWGVGEAAGTLAAFCINEGTVPRQVVENENLLARLQSILADDGVQMRWPADARSW